MFVKTPAYRLWKNKVARHLKLRRFRHIMAQSGAHPEGRRLRVLEIGCANGKDVIQFLDDTSKYDVYGVDIQPSAIQADNFTFVQGDAEALPFEDGFFDLVITVGLLEHIEPMEKLSRVAGEIARVGRAYVNIVPSVSTWLEPHAVSIRWPLRLHKEKVERHCQNEILHLNFLSDHTWSKFEGFRQADIRRFWYLFPFIRNTVIYKQRDI